MLIRSHTFTLHIDTADDLLMFGKEAGGSTVKGKRTPVFGIDHSGPGLWETYTLPNSLLRRRVLTRGRSELPKEPDNALAWCLIKRGLGVCRWWRRSSSLLPDERGGDYAIVGRGVTHAIAKGG